MKILVTGATGQLGHDVIKVLKQRNIECAGTESKELNITDSKAVLRYMSAYHPDAVVHCAAYTVVDQAEEQAERCWAVNAQGTRNVARACLETDAKLVYISTDYVFPGTGEKPYETGDPKEPLCVYGRTKLEGEEVVEELLSHYFIVRTSWVFGRNGGNFVKTMLRLGREKSEVNVVFDQIGSPTYTADLAPLLCDMAVSEKYGIYHATNEGYCSWADFASEIFRQTGCATKVNYIPSSAYPLRARRPLNSRLSKASLDKAGFSRLKNWKDALHGFLNEVDEGASDEGL